MLSVVANKTENTLKLYINPKYSREVYKTSAKNLGSNPYVEVQFGSVDEVDRFANAMVQAKKINSFSYKNESTDGFLKILWNIFPLILSSSSSGGCRDVWAAWAAQAEESSM